MGRPCLARATIYRFVVRRLAGGSCLVVSWRSFWLPRAATALLPTLAVGLRACPEQEHRSPSRSPCQGHSTFGLTTSFSDGVLCYREVGT